MFVSFQMLKIHIVDPEQKEEQEKKSIIEMKKIVGNHFRASENEEMTKWKKWRNEDSLCGEAFVLLPLPVFCD